MPTVEMPDGALVELPDNPSPELKAQIKAKVDQIMADQAAKGQATPETPGSASGALVGTQEANAMFDPGGSAMGAQLALEGEQEIIKGVAEQQAGANKTAMIARTAGPIIGGMVGALAGPVGATVGAGVGAYAGDWIAQDAEVDTGLRQAYNPLRAGAEVITAGYFSKFQAGKTLMQAAAKGSLGNMASDTFINLTEGKGLPNTFELAVSGITGSILSGVGHKAGDIWQARKVAALELTGSHQVADDIADFMGPRQTGEQLEFGLKPHPQQLELSPKASGYSPLDDQGLPMRRQAGEMETEARQGMGWPVPEPPEAPFVGPTQTVAKPGKIKYSAAQVAQRQKWTDEQMVQKFGFEDLDEGRTFEKILTQSESPDKYSLNLGYADGKDKPWVVHQITMDEQAEWAKMKALARGKKEMLETPLDRDPEFGDVDPITKSLRTPSSEPEIHPMRGVAKKAKEDLTWREKKRLGRTKTVQLVGRAKDVFKRLEIDHDYPVYQDYDKGSDLYRRAQQDVTRDSQIATDQINKMRKADRTAVVHGFMAGGDFSNLAPKLRAKAARLWDLADQQLGEYSLTAKQYFGEYLPQVASGKSMKDIIAEGVGPAAIPKRLQFAEDAAESLLSPQDPSLVRIMGKLIEVGAYRRHVAEGATEIKMRYGADSDAPKVIKDEMNMYLASLKGSTGDPSADKIDKLFSAITSTLGLPMTGTELANWLVRNSYAGLMAARPASVIKNAMQTIQMGIPTYGVKSFAVGLKRAMTEEGMEVARRAGVLGEGNTLREFGLQAGPVAKAVDIGFKPFAWVEERNRAISYLAGMDKFDSAVKKASKKNGRANWSTLMDKADIDKLSEPEIAVLSKMWDAGRPMEEIRHKYAQGIVDDTQFMYMMPERARALQSQGGRVAAGYANWSQGYASYWARMVGQGPKRKRTRQTLTFLGTNLALAKTFAEVGGIFGDEDSWGDALGWSFLGPMFYGGGPIVTTYQSMAEHGRKFYQAKEKPGVAAEAAIRDASAFVPFGGVTKDVYDAYTRSADKKEMAGRFLGFRRGK